MEAPMSRRNLATRSALIACALAGLALVRAPQSHADESFPATTPDGLQLRKSTSHSAVYVKPGATFSQYKRLALLDCYVDFAKDWARNYNQDQPGLAGQVRPSDMDRIKSDLAAEFRKVFTEELQTKGGYAITQDQAADVLVLRPAILNLVVNAPDLMTASMSATVVSSAGQMTLYLEFWDAPSRTLLARAIDNEVDQGMGGLPEAGGRVSNTVAADRILRRWADQLRQRLDQVRATATSDAAPPQK
jgi:hypothetical protein